MREPSSPLLRLAPRNGAGVAALAFGVAALALVLTFLLFPLGGLLGIVAILLGAIGIGRAARWRAFNRGQAVGGLVCGALALLLAAVLALRLDAPVSKRADELARLDRCMVTAGSVSAVADCARTFARRVGATTGPNRRDAAHQQTTAGASRARARHRRAAPMYGAGGEPPRRSP